MNCMYCGAAENTVRTRNTDPQGEPMSGWHHECADSAACYQRTEERNKAARERARARRALLDAITPRFALVNELRASPDADTCGNPQTRKGQLVRNSGQNHFLIDPPTTAARAIWYVDFSGDWGVRKVLHAEWSQALEDAIREWAAR